MRNGPPPLIRLTRTTLPALPLLFAAGMSRAQTAAPPAPPAVDAAIARMADACLQGDAAAYLADWAPDASLFANGSSPRRGSSAAGLTIADYFRRALVSGCAEQRLDAVAFDRAYVETGILTLTVRATNTAGVTSIVPVSTRFHRVWETSAAGAWKVTELIVQPAPGAAAQIFVTPTSQATLAEEQRTRPAPPARPAELATAMDAMLDGCGRGDLDRFSATWDPAVAQYFLNSAPRLGADAVRAYFADLFARSTMRACQMDVDDLRLFADGAVEVGSQALTMVRQSAAAPSTARARYFNVWKRNGDGRWALVRMGTLMLPSPTPAGGVSAPARPPAVCDSIPPAAGPPRLIPLPVRYDNDRYFAMPVTVEGDTLPWFMDTGGGGVWVTKPTLIRLGINPVYQGRADGDSLFAGGPFPTFRPGAAIPPPRCTGNQIEFGFGTVLEGPMYASVGQLGNTYYAGRVWVYDYPARTVAVYDKPPAPEPFGLHTIPMTLRDPPRLNHPRIQVLVAGDTVNMLLDTGASSELTPAGLQAIGGPAGWRASAFVATRQWELWRKAHPDWRVVARAEAHTGADMIEVPRLTIAGYEVGPIWFARRADNVFDGMMASIMDRPIQAAIGGAAFRSFRITMDYVNQRVTFLRP